MSRKKRSQQSHHHHHHHQHPRQTYNFGFVAEEPAAEPEQRDPGQIVVHVEPEPQIIEPEFFEPQVIEPQVIEPQVIEPQFIAPYFIAPEYLEADLFKPELIEPEITEPERTAPREFVPETKDEEEQFHHVPAATPEFLQLDSDNESEIFSQSTLSSSSEFPESHPEAPLKSTRESPSDNKKQNRMIIMTTVIGIALLLLCFKPHSQPQPKPEPQPQSQPQPSSPSCRTFPTRYSEYAKYLSSTDEENCRTWNNFEHKDDWSSFYSNIASLVNIDNATRRAALEDLATEVYLPEGRHIMACKALNSTYDLTPTDEHMPLRILGRFQDNDMQKCVISLWKSRLSFLSRNSSTSNSYRIIHDDAIKAQGTAQPAVKKALQVIAWHAQMLLKPSEDTQVLWIDLYETTNNQDTLQILFTQPGFEKLSFRPEITTAITATAITATAITTTATTTTTAIATAV